MNALAYDALPPFDEVDAADANLAFFGYDLVRDTANDRYGLMRSKAAYTKWNSGSSSGTEEGAYFRQLEKRLGRVPIE